MVFLLQADLVVRTSISLDIVLEVVERANENEDHLLVKFRDVIPNHEDNSTELTSDRDGVLRVQLLLFVGLAWCDQVPVNDTRLDVACEFDKDLAIGEGLVAKARDWALGLASLVDPGEQVVIRLVANDSHVVSSHELPDHSQDIFLISISDVLGAHSNHADSKGLHRLNGQVAVVVVIEHVLGRQLWLTPVDGAVFNAVADAQDD